MKGKPSAHPVLPKIFVAGQKLRIYFDWQSFAETGYLASFRQAFNNSLAEFRKLGIFSEIVSVGDSRNCDIFVTFAPILADFGSGDVIGISRFRAHPSNKKYVEIKLDPRANWAFAPVPWWKFWDDSARVERWLNHELLHALGCAHTTEKVSPMPSILDEDNWHDRRPDIPAWDRAYVRSLYGLPDPSANQL